MKSSPLRLVFLGLSLSSSWGNGHATTYRSLLKGLAALGHDLLFLERDKPWYAAHRDLAAPSWCELGFYDGLEDLHRQWGRRIEEADAVIVGSYVPDGARVLDYVLPRARLTAFYDIDTPVTVRALETGGTDYLEAGQIPRLDLYLSFTGGTLLQRLEREFCSRRAEALYCSVDETSYRPLALPVKWDLGYLGTYSADRQPALERLLIEPARQLPQRRFIVAGAQYPDDIVWPDNVERVEHLPPQEHAAFYGQLGFTLNITRADMIAAGWSPSVRLFEAGACGTAIISDRWRGIEEVFADDDALLLAETAGDVVAILEGCSAEDAARRGAAARRAVLARHTGRVRGGELIAALSRAGLQNEADMADLPRAAGYL